MTTDEKKFDNVVKLKTTPKNNVVKLPVLTESGMLEAVAELLDYVKQKRIDDLIITYRLKELEEDQAKFGVYWSVINVPEMIGILEKIKIHLIFADDELEGDEDSEE